MVQYIVTEPKPSKTNMEMVSTEISRSGASHTRKVTGIVLALAASVFLIMALGGDLSFSSPEAAVPSDFGLKEGDLSTIQKLTISKFLEHNQGISLSSLLEKIRAEADIELFVDY